MKRSQLDTQAWVPVIKSKMYVVSRELQLQLNNVDSIKMKCCTQKVGPAKYLRKKGTENNSAIKSESFQPPELDAILSMFFFRLAIPMFFYIQSFQKNYLVMGSSLY